MLKTIGAGLKAFTVAVVIALLVGGFVAAGLVSYTYQPKENAAVKDMTRGEWYAVQLSDAVYYDEQLWVDPEAKVSLVKETAATDVIIGKTGHGRFESVHAGCRQPGALVTIGKKPGKGWVQVHDGTTCVLFHR